MRINNVLEIKTLESIDFRKRTILGFRSLGRDAYVQTAEILLTKAFPLSSYLTSLVHVAQPASYQAP